MEGTNPGAGMTSQIQSQSSLSSEAFLIFWGHKNTANIASMSQSSLSSEAFLILPKIAVRVGEQTISLNPLLVARHF